MFKRNAISAASLLCLSAAMTVPAMAQNTQDLVEITGSAIKRSINDEGALPITVLKVEELRQSGVTSVEAVIQLLSANQGSTSSLNSIGSGTGGASYANLRGLGDNKTLVLLNGRRMTSFAFGANAVDLNTIPFAVIDRVEVLRDGASAVYGTDAIGGVINFITKNNYRGAQLVVETTRPSGDGGGKEGVSVTGGFGDLDKDSFNVWVSLDIRNQDRIRALDREFAKTGIIPSRGVNGNSPTTFPGNFTQASAPATPTIPGLGTANITAPGCAAPLSRVNPTNNKACVFDFSSTIDIVPDIKQKTVTGRTSIKFPGDHVLSVDALATENINTARVAPDPVGGITLQPSNPFYPRTYPGLDLTRPVSASYRMVPAGSRTNRSESSGNRLVADLSGVFADFDYKTGVFYTQSKAADAAADGYVNAPFVRAQVGLGNLNPFAEPTLAQLAVIEQAKRKGVFAQATGATRGMDARVSREMFDLPGGKAAFALAAEYRKETYRSDTNDDVVLGIPSAGRSPNHVGGNRTVKALGGELLLPVLKDVEIQLALRTDDYSDAGRSTNPKIGVRYQPMKQIAVRGSYNKGFRAPTLDDLYGPQTITFTAGALNDPLLCPGGVPDTSKGGQIGRDCANQPQVQQGGNPALKPEKSTTYSFGLALEPLKDVTVTLDYWNIKLKDQLGALPATTILADPVRYGPNIVRCNTLPASVQINLNRCGGLDANSNAIGYLVTLTDNIGQVKTDGIDVTMTYAAKLGSLGNVGLTYDATWVHSYTYQTNPSDAFKQNVGRYVDGSPVFRWKHTVGVNWSLADMSARLGVRHQTGYRDQNDAATVVGGASFYGDVKPYTLVDLSGTYKYNKAISLTVGVRNLFDTDPPFSNQSTRSQRGYDPRYTDAMGRAYFVRAAVGF